MVKSCLSERDSGWQARPSEGAHYLADMDLERRIVTHQATDTRGVHCVHRRQAVDVT